ncbi:MAG: NAD(P)/FAD-dependent oxidoreductase [Halocynthiibacter sp.]
MQNERFDTLILGAGAAGLMCAGQIRSGRVLLIDHAKRVGEKIRISGGGRCNFTNLDIGAENYISENPHFMKSALKRYTQWDFLDLIAKHNVSWHEKTLGQLFCDNGAGDIIDLLLKEAAHVDIRTQTSILNVTYEAGEYCVAFSDDSTVRAQNLVIATGGKPIPKMGATGFALELADQFDIPTTDTCAALVPFTFSGTLLGRLKPLAGLSIPARVTAGNSTFTEGLLFTHRGLSGPSILQASSYWSPGEDIEIAMLPDLDLRTWLTDQWGQHGRKDITSVLSEILPKKLAHFVASEAKLTGHFADLNKDALNQLAAQIQNWRVRPSGTEGYRTAEVMRGGIATDVLSSKTMEVKTHPGLYFIGEAVDVTGWLGGYNFQWAWSSGWAAAQAINASHDVGTRK